MAIKRNYAIWNNKGGVGKSTIVDSTSKCKVSENI